MSLDARDSPTIQRLLERLPEFKPTFDRFVTEEEGEFGSFWAMNELGRWAFPSNDEALLRRVFAAVDGVYADDLLGTAATSPSSSSRPSATPAEPGSTRTSGRRAASGSTATAGDGPS